MALARALQTELKRVGCDPGNVDGVWGDKAKRVLGLSLRASAKWRCQMQRQLWKHYRPCSARRAEFVGHGVVLMRLRRAVGALACADTREGE